MPVQLQNVGIAVRDLEEAIAFFTDLGRGVATYEDIYKLTYVRGPSGIIVMLAEELKKAN
ncbi:MAG TPA: hypothetical protein VFH76_01790 [Kribbella sp.]|nr:hypothetical protein [Kribbella sp.]